MPRLKPDRKERFAQIVASGVPVIQAYPRAGYKADPGGRNAFRLRHAPDVEERVGELLKRLSPPNIEARANERAIERLALSKEIVARELAKLAFGNLQDYTRLQGTVLVTDFSRTTRDQLAAVAELTVELYPEPADDAEQSHDGVEIFPPNKRLPVKRVRFKLADKRAALMDLAKLFGWVIEKREDVTKLEERLRAMTPEQREAEAHALYDRTKARLLQDRREREDRGEIVDEAGRTVGHRGGIGEPSKE